MGKFFDSLMMQSQGDVPSGVVFYDYLIGDGSAYVNTGIQVINNAIVNPKSISLTIYNNIAYTTASYKLFEAQSINPFYRVHHSKGKYWLGWGCTSANHISIGFTKGSTETLKFDFVNKLVFKGESEGVSMGVAYKEGAPLKPILIYAYNQRIYNVRIEYDGGIMNLIPCEYNGEVGLWDSVNRGFYGNDNSSGSFSVGNI